MRKLEIYEVVEISAMGLMLLLYAMRLYRKKQELKNTEIIDIETNVVE